MNSQNIALFLYQNPWILILILIWSLAWKGLALWRAARRGEQWWFVALLLINTGGLFEVLYIFIITKYFKKETAA